MTTKKVGTIRTIAIVWEYGKFAIALVPLALALVGVISPTNGASVGFDKF